MQNTMKSLRPETAKKFEIVGLQEAGEVSFVPKINNPSRLRKRVLLDKVSPEQAQDLIDKGFPYLRAIEKPEKATK